MKFESRDDWRTPTWLFDELHAEFDFTVDAAACAESAKLERYWCLEDDGTVKSWAGERIWCNPPYGKATTLWVDKAIFSRHNTPLSVLLVPSRTDTHWFQRALDHVSELRFIRGRVHFEQPPDMPKPPPSLASRPVFASLLLIFRPFGAPGPTISSMTTPRLRE